jgi:hypothetical protein
MTAWSGACRYVNRCNEYWSVVWTSHLEHVLINVFETTPMATDLTIDMAVVHFQQQRIIWYDPFVRHNAISDHCCVKCTPPISGVTITISSSHRMQFLREPPEATLLLSF